LSDTNDTPNPEPTGDPPEPSTPMTPDQLRAENARLRRESGGYRLRNKGELAGASRKISALLGEPIADEQDPPDIDSLIAKLDPSKHATALKAKDGEIRGLKLRASLAEAFHREGLKPGLARAALLDGGHMSRLESAVDASDFDEQIETTLGELVESMPELRGSSTAPIRSSAQMRPPQNDSQILSRDELAGMDPEEVAAALRSGKLDSILGRS
jgi:hypothetical protein